MFKYIFDAWNHTLQDYFFSLDLKSNLIVGLKTYIRIVLHGAIIWFLMSFQVSWISNSKLISNENYVIYILLKVSSTSHLRF